MKLSFIAMRFFFYRVPTPDRRADYRASPSGMARAALPEV
jgi:hypothetical protein